jgi:hypothetical protein
MTELTDDEALRHDGMTDGKKKKGKFVLRPMTGLSLSWLQRNKVFDDDFGDPTSKTAAFVYLHSEDKETIRSVVNNKSEFLNAVDDWIEKHVPYHTGLNQYVEIMNDSMNTYLAASSTALNPSTKSPTSKN